MRHRLLTVGVVLLTAGVTAGCDRVYYGTMKRFGMEKRDILISRVREAREAQTDAQQEFTSALDRFRAVVEVDGGSLEEKYEQLDRELKRAEDRAKKVRDRVDAVRDVSKDLFREWEKELGQYSNRALKAESERELRETRTRTDRLIAAMQRSERKIGPVLQPLRDRVLFLKHNLNARALGALTKELASVESNVDALVADLKSSIAEADAYLKVMEQEQTGALDPHLDAIERVELRVIAAETFRRAGRDDRDAWNRALQMATGIGDAEDASEQLSRIVTGLAETGRPDEALAATRHVRDSHDRTFALIAVAKAMLAGGTTASAAADILREAATVERSTSDPDLVGAGFREIGKLLRRAGLADEAKGLFREAMRRLAPKGAAHHSRQNAQGT
jgi:hypothetical protein